MIRFIFALNCAVFSFYYTGPKSCSYSDYLSKSLVSHSESLYEEYLDYKKNNSCLTYEQYLEIKQQKLALLNNEIQYLKSQEQPLTEELSNIYSFFKRNKYKSKELKQELEVLKLRPMTQSCKEINSKILEINALKKQIRETKSIIKDLAAIKPETDPKLISYNNLLKTLETKIEALISNKTNLSDTTKLNAMARIKEIKAERTRLYNQFNTYWNRSKIIKNTLNELRDKIITKESEMIDLKNHSYYINPL